MRGEQRLHLVRQAERVLEAFHESSQRFNLALDELLQDLDSMSLQERTLAGKLREMRQESETHALVERVERLVLSLEQNL